jgi:Domain of unknown function DUF29
MRDDNLYETDFFAWTEQQAEALRRAGVARVNAPLDWENIAEEIESLGKRDRREAMSLVKSILEHLIKLAASPATEPRAGWRKELGAFRDQLAGVLDDSPSLRRALPDWIVAIWPRAMAAARENLAENGELARDEPLLNLLDANSVSAADLLDWNYYLGKP